MNTVLCIPRIRIWFNTFSDPEAKSSSVSPVLSLLPYFLQKQVLQVLVQEREGSALSLAEVEQLQVAWVSELASAVAVEQEQEQVARLAEVGLAELQVSEVVSAELVRDLVWRHLLENTIRSGLPGYEQACSWSRT